jgi:hypothetical protein
MAKDTSAVLVEKLDTAIGLLKHLVVLELARQGQRSRQSPSTFTRRNRPLSIC